MLPDEYSQEELDRRNAVRMAEGYAALEMYDAAASELTRLGAALQEHPEVLKCRLGILIQRKRWLEAAELGRRLCNECPDEPDPFIHTAYGLHERGQTEEALRTLRMGPECLQDKALYHYNCGCYLAVLGNHRQACECLTVAFALDEKLRLIAEVDPDLKGLEAFLSANPPTNLNSDQSSQRERPNDDA